MKMDTNEIFNLVNEIQKDETHPLEKMTVEIIEKIKQNIKEKKERK